jgi:protein TonB
MTGVQSPPSAHSRSAVARFGTALAASVLAHWMLLSSPLVNAPQQAVASDSANAPLTVRLAALPEPVQSMVVFPALETADVPPPQPSALGVVEPRLDGRALSGMPQHLPEGLSLASAPDLHYYTPQDLDSYPTPLAPLQFGRPADDAAGEVRLEILVDERGIVQDVIQVRPPAPGRVDEGVRATLAATRFLPAHKNGRAVKSRVTIRVRFEPDDDGE